MIGHIDADAFFASALQRKNPHLRGKPLLALGMGGGCVIAASYEAKAFGVKTGMPLKEAKKLCPQALALPSDFREALAASREIEMILRDQSPVVEQMSVDEWFLDLHALVGGLPADLDAWAERMQQTISQRVGLTVSIGIGPTKLLAKMASEYRKPAGITIVQSNTVILNSRFQILDSQFLRSRPAAAIPGIGRKRQLRTEQYQWHTAYDVAHADTKLVHTIFGKTGREMQMELQGIPVHTVQEETKPPKSISRCRSFRPTKDMNFVFGHLLHHLTYVTLKMRRQELVCTAFSIWIRSGNYQYDGREVKIPQPTDTEEQLLPYLKNCFEKLQRSHLQCTQVGLALYGLRPKGGVQYSLFESPKRTNESEAVQKALDSLHTRYGRGSVMRGSMLITTDKLQMKQLHEY